MRVYRFEDVLNLTGYTRQHIDRLEKAGHTPKRFKLCPGSGRNGAVGWDAGEWDIYMKSRAAERDAA